jgi:elongation factor G
MKSVDLAHLRTVVLAGHTGAGKTTLAEHLLHVAGATTRLGNVADGTSVLDYEPEEHKRKLSLSLAVASLEHNDHVITLIDTPGYADFAGEVVQGFAAADGALFVMDASGGVEAGTERAIGLGRSTGTPAMFVLSKCDRENADPNSALDALRSAFGSKIAPLELAIGKAENFRGYVDLVHRKAYLYQDSHAVETEIPAEMADDVAMRRDQLLEAAAEADDDVLTKYLEGEEITDEELEKCLHRGVRDSILAPVVLAAAPKDVGLVGLLDAIVTYLPSPSEEPVTATDKAGKEVVVTPDPNGPLLIHAFKTAADPFVGKLTYLRVHSGTLRSHDHVWNPGKGEEERIGQLLMLKGKDQEPVGELRAGQVGAVAKLGHTVTGDTLTSRDHPLTLPPLEFPRASLAVAIDPESKTDLDKLGPALHRLEEEEPTIRVERQAETGEQLLWAQGENQVHVVAERLKRKFGVSILTRPPRIPYRETIRGKAEVEGRHKKQTGGRGQFGHVWIRIEPNPEGGVAFEEKIVGGVVPRQFFAGVEKGVRDVAVKGVLAGFPVIDFKATLYDGSYHNVDSDELSFKIASSMATRKGILDATPVLLEPVMDVEIRVPEEFMGDVNRDLNGRRGRVLGMDSNDGTQVIKAHVPMSELASYATELRSLTGGRGTFNAALDHYEEVPSHIAQRVIDEHKKDGEAAAAH